MTNERGFTLTELMIAVAVLAITVGGIVVFQQQGQTAFLVGAARVDAQQSARVALDTMLNELRGAVLSVDRVVTAVDANCANGPAPGTGGGTSISFSAVDPTSGATVAVQYQLVGTDLQRNGAVGASGVQKFLIWCYGADGALTSSLPGIVLLEAFISTQTQGAAASSPSTQQASVDGRTRLRNMP